MTRIVNLLQRQITIDLVVKLVTQSESAIMTKSIVDLLTELVIEQNKFYRTKQALLHACSKHKSIVSLLQ